MPRADLPTDSQEAPIAAQDVSGVSMQSAGGSRQYVLTHSPEVRTLLSWIAPNRPHHRRGKEYFVNVVIILFALEVILFLFHQYMLMVLAFSVVVPRE